MKLWNQYGSEHSMNLVMIGSFKQPGDAEAAKLLRDEITEQVKREPDLLKERPPGESRFSKEMMDFLIKSHLNTVGAAELEQFLYDVSVEKKGNKVILRTDESEVSAFMKILIEKGAKVEVYSAHEYPERELPKD